MAIAKAAKPKAKPPARSETDDENGGPFSVGHIEGRLKAKSVKKVGEMVDRHPDETLSILRHWLHEDHRVSR